MDHDEDDDGQPPVDPQSAQPDDAGLSGFHRCVKCEDEVESRDTLSAGRSGRICKLCYNSARALSEHFRKRGKKEEWQAMPPAKKKKLIIENKAGGGIRGKSRTIKMTEEAGWAADWTVFL